MQDRLRNLHHQLQESRQSWEKTPAMKKQETPSHKLSGEDPVFAGGSPEIQERIRRLRSQSNHGLYAMALFLVISIGAIQDFAFLPSLTADFRAILGTPPSANMISTALLIYTFSATILVLSRMTTGSRNYSGVAHVLYLSIFYLFYPLSGVLEDNFWAAFAAGTTILGLESYHIWTFCNEDIRKELEAIEDAARRQRL